MPRPLTAPEHLAAAARFAARAYNEAQGPRRSSRWWWQRRRHRRNAEQMTGLAVANALIALGYAIGADEEPATAQPSGIDQVLAEALAKPPKED